MSRLPAPSMLAEPDFDGLPMLAPALAADVARMFRQLGIESVRASVVDLGTMAFLAAWTITDNGDISDENPDRPLDSQFPGAAATIGQLAHSPVDQTVVQRLSPRRWSFAWRIDTLHVVLAEARYRDMRAAVTQVDTALVRLLCDTGIHGHRGSDTAPGNLDNTPAWSQSRERRKHRRSPIVHQLSLALMVVAGALALWLGLVALPDARDAAAQAQASAARMRSIADSTMVRGLSTALATGDYGEVQNELTSFESLGYFNSAAVVNARGRVVSLSGPAEGLRIGSEVPAEVSSASRSFDLSMGSERYGQLLLLKAAAADGVDSRFMPLRIAALVSAAAALAAALLKALQLRRSRRIGD